MNGAKIYQLLLAWSYATAWKTKSLKNAQLSGVEDAEAYFLPNWTHVANVRPHILEKRFETSVNLTIEMDASKMAFHYFADEVRLDLAVSKDVVAGKVVD